MEFTTKASFKRRSKYLVRAQFIKVESKHRLIPAYSRNIETLVMKIYCAHIPYNYKATPTTSSCILVFV